MIGMAVRNFLRFNGVGAHVELLDNPLSNQVCAVEVLVRSTSQDRQLYLGRGTQGETPPSNTLELGVAGDFAVYHKTETGNGIDHDYIIPTSINPVDGNWHWIQQVIEPGRLTVLIDGELQGVVSNYENSDGTNPQTSLGAWGTGSLTSSDPKWWNGDIAEARVWSTPPTLSELQETIHQELTGTEPGLASLYRLDEGSGERIYNAVTGLEAGIIRGAIWRGIISGKVALYGNPVTGAIVRAVNQSEITQAFQIESVDGRYELEVPPGLYHVTVEYQAAEVKYHDFSKPFIQVG